MKLFLFLLLLSNVACATISIGHRGACGYAPENTLLSFEKAIELGVDMIEFDVHLCKSGELVVIHDATVDRVSNGTGFVADKTLDELQNLDLGYDQIIPTLEQVLDCIDRRVKVDIELKGENTAPHVAEIIRRYVVERGWSYDDFLVTSFNHYELVDFQRHCNMVAIAPIISSIPLGYAAFVDYLSAQYVVADYGCVNAEFIEDAHQRGIKVFLYTLNHPQDIAHARGLGTDGLFSDYPDRLR